MPDEAVRANETAFYASVAAVTAAGGSVVRGPYAFPGGRRFHFADPSGNELGVYATS